MENRKQVHMIIGLGEHSNLGVFFNILSLTYEAKASSQPQGKALKDISFSEKSFGFKIISP